MPEQCNSGQSSSFETFVPTIQGEPQAPLFQAWLGGEAVPASKSSYLWIFCVQALVLIAHLIVLLYQNKDRIAALILQQPIPVEESSV